MIRTLLIEAALFLTPFVIYGAILMATRGSLVPANWSARAVLVCALAAVALMALGLFVFEADKGAPPGSRYVPAQMKDGVFVPGRYE
ncbi:DUF6111 family protein [Aquabacter spiritensis]|uniref:NADH-quinone oxidoreductase subunit M n=1 Tax=Aquabacter spiritensis TaxID=933073 RepID=A0A4R3LR31_9HYPH|nr:DUF6111 family protein [Aquabacter spiritensis]TCT02166.1 hypothetical protein EDC64_11426 [Aquabacter spiritensis]